MLRGIRRNLIVLGVLLMSVAAAVPASPAVERAEDFILVLGNDAIAVLGDTRRSIEQRQIAFRRLFVSGFDIERMSQFALGRFWRGATDAQRAEFRQLFLDSIIAIYFNRLSRYSGETIVVTDSHRDETTTVVQTIIEWPSNKWPGAPPTRVDWRVRSQGGEHKVVDVIVEGVSMAITQRSEFASVIQNNGGQVEALLAAMRQRASGR
jgi:phospholipid transport system substrate-binding protein